MAGYCGGHGVAWAQTATLLRVRFKRFFGNKLQILEIQKDTCDRLSFQCIAKFRIKSCARQLLLHELGLVPESQLSVVTRSFHEPLAR